MRAPIDYHAAAVELCQYACGGEAGRPETDPVYQAVTEGRDRPPYPNKYSSCGDLAHWLLYRLGVRLHVLNRSEHEGWATGVNVSRLSLSSLASIPSKETTCQPGDIGIVWSKPKGEDAHVFVILDDQQPYALLVAEYGQPGGKVNVRRIRYDGKRTLIGTRTLYRLISLDKVLDQAEAAGKLEQPELAGVWSGRLELPTWPPGPGAAA